MKNLLKGNRVYLTYDLLYKLSDEYFYGYNKGNEDNVVGIYVLGIYGDFYYVRKPKEEIVILKVIMESTIEELELSIPRYILIEDIEYDLCERK